MTTESPSKYDHLEMMQTYDLLLGINKEDHEIASVVKEKIQIITDLIDDIHRRMAKGGRLFYIGAGTSGRLGILDASECPPTYGVSPDLVIGIIAGGDRAIRSAVEFAEDDYDQAWRDISSFNPRTVDTILGLSASGRTPYVVGGLKKASSLGLLTGGITCNLNGEIADVCHHCIELLVGPEFVTGSTRMKSGTAQKMVLNMISTSLMIKLGHVKGNSMVDMQLSNEKLIKRGIRMIINATNVSEYEAAEALNKYGSVRKVLNEINLKPKA